jgi:hypothetical protein
MITNCLKCNKVFPQGHSPICAECVAANKTQVRQVVDFVSANPGLTLQELASKTGLQLKDLEEMLFSGRLGTAAECILLKCQGCQAKMSVRSGKGHFCQECASLIEPKTPQPDPDQLTALKPKLMKRSAAHKAGDQSKSSQEVAANAAQKDSATGVEVRTGMGESKQPPHSDGATRQEPLGPTSPMLDSYGFKRVSDL